MQQPQRITEPQRPLGFLRALIRLETRHDIHFIEHHDRQYGGFHRRAVCGQKSCAALTMNHDLGLSATQFGWGAGIMFAGYCVFEVPSNLALYRFGARRWLARIVITWGFFAAATALAVGPKSGSGANR